MRESDESKIKKKGKKGRFIYYLFPFFLAVYFHLLLFVAAVGVPATNRE
jgi:hypothetical protein